MNEVKWQQHSQVMWILSADRLRHSKHWKSIHIFLFFLPCTTHDSTTYYNSSGMEASREKWNVMKIEIGPSKLEDACGSVITYFIYFNIWAEYRISVWQHIDDSPEVMCDICYANINYMLSFSVSNACNIEFFPSLPHLSVPRLLDAGPRMIKQDKKKICVKFTFPLAPHRSLSHWD